MGKNRSVQFHSVVLVLYLTSLHFTSSSLSPHLTTTYSNVLVLGCPPRVSCAKCTTFICINIIFTQLEAQCSTPSTCTRMEWGRDRWMGGYCRWGRKRSVGVEEEGKLYSLCKWVLPNEKDWIWKKWRLRQKVGHTVDIPPPLHNNMTMMMTHPPVPKHRDYFSTIHEQPPTTEWRNKRINESHTHTHYTVSSGTFLSAIPVHNWDFRGRPWIIY